MRGRAGGAGLRSDALLSAALSAAALLSMPWPGAASDVEARLRSAGRADLGPPWQEAEALERSARSLERDRPSQAVERYLEAARRFRAIARERTGLAQPWWRSARSFWLAGDALALDAEEQRLRHFEAARALCDEGLAVDPDCAECMLWKFNAMGRLRTTRISWASPRDVSVMMDHGDARRAAQAGVLP